MDQERRVESEPIEIEERSAGSPVIRGLAAVYDRLSSDLGGFKEKIAPGAFDAILERKYKKSDVVALWNHDRNQLLGRTSSGTLRLTNSEQGLRYELDPPDTSLGRDLMVMLRRGDVTGSSFAFTIEEESWDETDPKNPVRTVIRCRDLFDVSLVTTPAYPDSRVALRSLEALRASREPAAVALEKYQPTLAFRKLVADASFRVWDATRGIE